MRLFSQSSTRGLIKQQKAKIKEFIFRGPYIHEGLHLF
jgi:hypothetical protein